MKFQEYGLSPRERDYLSMLADGRSSEWMAEELGISKDTVKKAIGRIYLKMDVKNAAQAVALAIREGIIV